MRDNIRFYDPTEVDRIIRPVNNDLDGKSPRLFVVQADHGQILSVMRRVDSSYSVYYHDSELVRDVCDDIVGAVGLDLPDDFLLGTAVYSVGGFIFFNGLSVPLRILRQQIFLGGSVVPVDNQYTMRILLNGIGNAVWNFLDHKLWRNRADWKNEYRDIRSYRGDGDSYESAKHQHSLFYVASEDFRFFFGPAEAGRGIWYLDKLDRPVHPPPPEAADFWRREIDRYGSRESKTSRETSVSEGFT